jgi:glucosylceramidase
MKGRLHIGAGTLLAAALTGLVACGSAEDAGDDAITGGVFVYQTSRAGDKLTEKKPLPVRSAGEPTGTVITLSPDKERQQIVGFGGSLTESSAATLATLPKEKRKEIIDAYFSSEGAGYTLTRTHIASCDFSVASYQYSTEPDPELKDFSIEHDKKQLLPLLKDAIASARGSLKVIAAPWSAPAWMKNPEELFIKPAAENSYRGVDPSLKPEYLETYALYLSKYIKAYEAEGVPIWGLSPQNEPLGNGGNWETMRWEPSVMRTFIRDHLGPRLEADKIDAKLMVFDHNKGEKNQDAARWAEYLLADKEAAKYIWGTAVHWYASTVDAFPEGLDAIHEADPTKAIIASEATIDGLSDRKGMPPSAEYQDSWLKDDWYWTKSAYDWGYWWLTGPARDQHPVYEPVYRYARDIIVGLNHWYVGWVDWNAVLDTTGGPNHQNNLCAAPVMVNTETKDVYFSPLFHVMSHFSKFIRPDAHVIGSKVTLAKDVSLEGYDKMPTEGLLATAAKNADGSFAVVLFNQTAKPIAYSVVLDGKVAEGSIDAQALQTLLWKDK